MRMLLNLKPGKKGTKQLLAQYGDRLPKHVRARWNPDQKVWQIRYSQAVALGLVDRIQVEDGIQ